jgi:hypothetical protein
MQQHHALLLLLPTDGSPQQSACANHKHVDGLQA